MQLFGILLVLNRKSRLGRQHSRTSGASRVRGANGHWKTASYCLMCSMTDDRWRWRGSDDRRIRKEGKSMWRFFQWIYQAFFHKSPTTILPLSNLSIFRRAYMVTMQQPHDVWQESLWSVLLCEMHLITNWQTNPVRHPCSVHCTYKVLHRTTLCSTGLLKFRDTLRPVNDATGGSTQETHIGACFLEK